MVEEIEGDEVHVVAVRTLPGHRAPGLGHAVGVPAFEAPGLLHPGAKRGVLEPRLAYEETELQPEVPGFEVEKALRDHSLQHRGVGGGAVDGGGAESANGVDEEFAPADPEGHRRATRRLEGQVVAHSPDPELEVEAVDGDVSGAEAAGAKRASARFGVARGIIRGKRRRERPARGPRSAVDPVDVFGGSGEVVAERGMRGLGIAQHLLGGERVGGQILEPLRWRPAFPQAPVEG